MTVHSGNFLNDCRICGHTAEHPSWQAKNMRFKDSKRFTYFQCSGCNCLQIEKMPENISIYYPDSYYSFKEVSPNKHHDWLLKSYLRMTGAFLGTSVKWYGTLTRKVFSLPPHHEWFYISDISFGSRILDVGCGSGSLLLRICKEGFRNIMGIDPFISKDIFYNNGLIIKKKYIEDLKNNHFYDLIMLNHSLEHMPDQFTALQHVHRLLKTGATVLIRIPVSNSLAWEMYRTNWIRLESPRHLFLHSEKSMEILSEKCGFSIKEIIYDSGESQFYASELCKAGILIQDHQNFLKKGHTLFNKKQLRHWKKLARELNKNKKGDIACFYLCKR